MDIYSYEPIARHPELLALYTGWLGQKIHFLTHSAVTLDQSDSWAAAATEVDRLAIVLHYSTKAKVLKLSGETKTALYKFIGYFSASGWWTSKDGTQERMAHRQALREQDELPDNHEIGNTPFQPGLLLERDPAYSVAPAVTNQLDALLMQTAIAMDNLDLCRLGVSLAGFCYRSTPQLGIPFINSILNNLAARDMTDLQAENEFRRALGLLAIIEDRRPLLAADLALRPPITLDNAAAGRGGGNSFESLTRDVTAQRDLVLACVFRRFDVMVPPAECDASQYPELSRLKKKLQAASVKTTKSAGKTKLTEKTEFWSEEALEYLGIARRNLVRPDMALQRLIKKGALRPTKIGGRLLFKKAELDRVLERGDQAPRRGRPRKDGK